jgi:hypothetical protein
MFYDIDTDELDYSVLMDVPFVFDILEGDILEVEIPPNWYGEFTVNVSVSDGDLTNFAYFDIIIDPVNDLPILNSTGPLGAYEDEWFNTTFTGYDPLDGDEVTFFSNATDVIPGLVEGVNYFFYPNGSFHLLPDNDMVGEYIFRLFVDDGNGSMASMNVSLTIMNVNDAPTGTILEPTGALTIENGGNVTFDAAAVDVDGDELGIRWVMTGDIGEITIGSGTKMVYTFIIDGIFNVTCLISDGKEEIAIGNVMITVFTPQPENTAPYDLIGKAGPDIEGLDEEYGLEVAGRWVLSREIPVDASIILTASAKDDDEDVLTYTWTLAEDPNWMMTGAEITIPAGELSKGTYTFKVTLDDGHNHSVEETLDPITIVGPYEDSSETDNKRSILSLTMIIVVVVLVLLVLALIIFLIIGRKEIEAEE